MKQAFTLIELLVVVLIIGILSVVAVPQYQKAVLKSRFMQTQLAMRTLKDALERYYLANNTYPTTLEELDITLPGTLNNSKTSLNGHNFTCNYFYQQTASNSLMCFLKSTSEAGSEFGLRYFLGNNQVFCTTRVDNAKEMCKMMGGKNGRDNGNGLWMYVL